MKFKLIIFLLLIIALDACQNIEGTESESPATYMRVYEGPYGYTAANIETSPEGYVILANSSDPDGNPVTIVFKIDQNGNRIGAPTYITGGSGSFIKALPSPETGYVIIGDSIQNQANPANVNDFQVISTRIIVLDQDLNPVQKIVKTDEVNAVGKIDYRGTSITIAPDGKLVVLGSYQESDDTPIKPYISTFSKTGSTYQETWYKPINLLDQDYQNAKSVFYSDGKITWATAIANEQQNFNFSYVSIPTLQDGSVYVNNSLIGATTEQLFIPSDLYPFGVASGYGVIGTYGSTTKTSKNIFFVRVNESGSIIEGTEKYYDGISISSEKDASQIEDTGEAIVSTFDGGFILAGTMQTIPGNKGNGARDILLIKVNENGDPIWTKNIGGAGDEVVRTVKEFSDGSVLIFGTNTLGGFPSIFLIKTNALGEL
jgi:hypothetical protein